MSTKTLAKSRVALAIILLLSLLFLIQTKENKMAWYNPATWTPVDAIQNGISDLLNVAQTTSNASLSPGSVSSVSDLSPSTTDQTPQTLGVQSPTAVEGALAYNPDGTISEYRNGQWVVSYGTQAGQNNPNPVTSQQLAAQDAARSSLLSGRQNIFDTLNARGQSEAGASQLRAQNAIDAFRQSQQGIDQQRINNAMNQQQSSQSILDMINQGMRNTNVRLSNKNAANSSAQGAAARAYAAMGAKQQSAANNQYELQNKNIDVAQGNLNTSINQERAKREFEKTNLVNSLVDQARQSFLALNDAAAGASIGDRIAIEQEKENIRQQLLAQLQGAENFFNTGVSGITPLSTEGAAGQASQLRAAGQVSPDAFMAQAPTVSQTTQGGSPIFNVIANRRKLIA